MNEQNQVKRVLRQQASIEVIRELLAHQEHKSRSSVAELICQHFGFLDARGRSQIAGCVKALGELERAGHFALPAPMRKRRTTAGPRRLGQPVELAMDVPTVLGVNLRHIKASESRRNAASRSGCFSGFGRVGFTPF